MSDGMAQLLAAVLRRVADLVDDMDDAGLRTFASGDAGVGAAQPTTGTAPARGPAEPATAPATPRRKRDRSPAHGKVRVDSTVSHVEAAEAKATLLAMSSLDEAREYLASFGTIPRLRSLADVLGVPLLAKEPKANLIRKIAAGTLGVRLTSEAMHSRPADRPAANPR